MFSHDNTSHTDSENGLCFLSMKSDMADFNKVEDFPPALLSNFKMAFLTRLKSGSQELPRRGGRNVDDDNRSDVDLVGVVRARRCHETTSKPERYYPRSRAATRGLFTTATVGVERFGRSPSPRHF